MTAPLDLSALVALAEKAAPAKRYTLNFTGPYRDFYDACSPKAIISLVRRVQDAERKHETYNENYASTIRTLTERCEAAESRLLKWGAAESPDRQLEIAREQLVRAEAERDRLRAAMEGVLGLFDSGWAVRDISRDHEPGFSMRQIEPVRRLAEARAALSPIDPEATWAA